MQGWDKETILPTWHDKLFKALDLWASNNINSSNDVHCVIDKPCRMRHTATCSVCEHNCSIYNKQYEDKNYFEPRIKEDKDNE